MDDLLSDLAARAAGRTPVLRPRPPSRFEAAGSAPASPWPAERRLDQDPAVGRRGRPPAPRIRRRATGGSAEQAPHESFGRPRPRESPWRVAADPEAASGEGGTAAARPGAARRRAAAGATRTTRTVDPCVADWLAAVESSQLSAGGSHPLPGATPLIRPRSPFAPPPSDDPSPLDLGEAGAQSVELGGLRAAPATPRIRRQADADQLGEREEPRPAPGALSLDDYLGQRGRQ